MEVYLTPQEVSERYKGRISTATLSNWRSSGIDGPAYVKIGGRVMYKLSDIEAWEARRTRGTSEKKIKQN